MTIREIADKLDAAWLCCEEEGDRELHTAFASDMMSDVLACVTEDTLLLTGMVNSPVRAYLRDAGRALRNLCAKQGAAGGCAGIGKRDWSADAENAVHDV